MAGPERPEHPVVSQRAILSSGMAIFQSDAKALLKRLADKTYGTSQERDQLLAQLAQTEGLKARDVAWMLFRPDRAYREAVVGLLKKIADPETADVVIAQCEGKPEAAVRAAATTLFSLGIPGTEKRLAAAGDRRQAGGPGRRAAPPPRGPGHPGPRAGALAAGARRPSRRPAWPS